MDSSSTIKEEPLLELEITIVKEELFIPHHYDQRAKTAPQFTTESIVKEESETVNSEIVHAPLERSIHHNEHSTVKEESETVNSEIIHELVERPLHHNEQDDEDPEVYGAKKLLCDLCDFKVSSENEIRNHYLLNHVIGTHQRDKSASDSATKKNKKYKCPHCDYRSYLTAHVKRHVMIHTGETPYDCPKCQFKTRDTSTLRRHIRTQHERNLLNKPTTEGTESDKMYVCSLCSYTSKDQRWLTRHELAFHNAAGSLFHCQHCQFRCMRESTFTNHILLHNGIAAHSCQLCDYKTNIPNELSKHMIRKHSDVKPFKCTECNYRTNCRSDLTKHSIIHKNIRPYSCSLCDYKCKRSSHLKAHQAVHGKDMGKYTCTFCKYRTMNLSCLKIHVRKHTGEKPFQCDSCDAEFTSISAKNLHALSHLKSWSQTCPICKFTSDKPQVFKRHAKTHGGFTKYRSQRKKKLCVSTTDEHSSSSE